MRQTCVNVKIQPTKMHLSSCKNATVLQDRKNAKCALALRLNGAENTHPIKKTASNKSCSKLNFIHFQYSFKDRGTSSLMSFASNNATITVCILTIILVIHGWEITKTQPRSSKLYWKYEVWTKNSLQILKNGSKNEGNFFPYSRKCISNLSWYLLHTISLLPFYYNIIFQPYQTFEFLSSTLEGDRYMCSCTFLYKIQFQTTFILSFFWWDVYIRRWNKNTYCPNMNLPVVNLY